MGFFFTQEREESRDGEKNMREMCFLTLVVPLDFGVRCDDGANHTSLGLVGLVVCLGVCGGHRDLLDDVVSDG